MNYSKDDTHENNKIQFSSLDDFYKWNNSDKLKASLSYDKAYRVETTPEEDEVMRNTGDKFLNRPYSLKEKKNPAEGQNCADLAADIIGAVSRLKITKYHVLGFTRPNSQYDSFVDDNDGHSEYIFSEGRNYLRKWKQSNMANLQEEMYRHIKDSIPEEK